MVKIPIQAVSPPRSGISAVLYLLASASFYPNVEEASTQILHEETSYVNAKQFNRILKRRDPRNQVETKLGFSSGNEKNTSTKADVSGHGGD